MRSRTKDRQSPENSGLECWRKLGQAWGGPKSPLFQACRPWSALAGQEAGDDSVILEAEDEEEVNQVHARVVQPH